MKRSHVVGVTHTRTHWLASRRAYGRLGTHNVVLVDTWMPLGREQTP